MDQSLPLLSCLILVLMIPLVIALDPSDEVLCCRGDTEHCGIIQQASCDEILKGWEEEQVEWMEEQQPSFTLTPVIIFLLATTAIAFVIWRLRK